MLFQVYHVREYHNLQRFRLEQILCFPPLNQRGTILPVRRRGSDPHPNLFGTRKSSLLFSIGGSVFPNSHVRAHTKRPGNCWDVHQALRTCVIVLCRDTEINLDSGSCADP